MRRALGPDHVRELIEAEHFAEKRGKKLNTTITVHPKLLTEYPDDVGRWLWRFLNQLRIWCCRSGFGYYTIWVRENYDGDRREHVHLMLYVPLQHRPALEAALGRWLPGAENVVHVGDPKYKTDRYGRRVNEALTYRLKQMTPQAWYALEKKVRREKACRETHAPVAAVLGKRSGVSRTLSKTTRTAFWTQRRPVAPSSEKYPESAIATEFRNISRG